ncbi:MAG: flavoprotein [Parcubacteria group bacterium]|nr:flavoprotein [Parcubacteria group bacterium]
MHENKAKSENTSWDVVVIGGGPAGMMAAGKAAELGAHVLLLEKNATLGRKLLITGGGRCNVTNAEPDLRTFLSKFKSAKEFLFSPFSSWDNHKSIQFFTERGCPIKIENEGRAFPVSNSAQSVWNVMVEYIKKGNVTVQSNSPVSGFVTEDGKIKAVVVNGKEIEGTSFILATGGKSRPETGSTGDGFEWLKKIGHKVEESNAALVPIAVSESWIDRLSGLSLLEVKVTLFQSREKQAMKKGKLLFTHVGLSGPVILNMSKEIGELLKYGEVELKLDLLPHLAHDALNKQLQDIFKEHDKKKFKNTLSSLVPPKLAPIIIEQSGIDPDKSANSVTREERLKLIEILKNFSLHPTHLLGLDKAVITSGGVSLDEVNFKTMSSTLYKNLYFAGDILDIDRPTGGYGLQLCWTTGMVAGTSSVSDITTHK